MFVLRSAALLSLALLATACGGSSSNAPAPAPGPAADQGPAMTVGLRVAHVANAPAASATLGQWEIPGTLAAGQLSERVMVPEGSRTLTLTAGGAEALSQRLTLDPDTQYTAWVVGSTASNSLDVVLTTDEFPAAVPGQAFVRFLNAAPQASPLEFVADGRGYASDLNFKAVSNYITVPAGGVRFQARGAAEAELGVNFEAGRVYTVVAHELSGGSLGLTIVNER